MDEIKLVKANVNNFEVLQHIGRKTFFETFAAVNTEENMRKYLEESFDEKKVKDELSNPGSEFYFAVIHPKTIGYLKINTGSAQTELKDNKALEIERIYILKEFYGKQVGQLLYEQAFKIAQEKQVDYIWLGVWEHNARARAFYNRNGFIEFSNHIFKLGKDEQTDILMRKNLNTTVD
jgi:ribosomal protein S18 acetylase RimI-like enzyme